MPYVSTRTSDRPIAYVSGDDPVHDDHRPAVERRLHGRGARGGHDDVGRGQHVVGRAGHFGDRHCAPRAALSSGANSASSSDGARATTNCTPATRSATSRAAPTRPGRMLTQSRSAGCPGGAPRRAGPDRADSPARNSRRPLVRARPDRRADGRRTRPARRPARRCSASNGKITSMRSTYLRIVSSRPGRQAQSCGLT